MSARLRFALTIGIAFSAGIAASSVANAQNPKRLPIGPKIPVTDVGAAADDRATLLRAEDGWAGALVRKDRAYFEKTLDSAFVYTEDAQLMTRSEVMKALLDPQDVATKARNEGMVVHPFGTTAVVTGVLIVEGHLGKASYEHRYRFTDTWAKRADGTWRIVAAQDYLMPAKAPARR